MIWLLVACSGDLSVTPTALPFGEVNFNEARPPEGYAARDLALTNNGGRSLDISLVGFDTDHLFGSSPFFVDDDPPTLPPLAPGDTAVIGVGVWEYALGELTTEVSGTFRIDARGLKDPIPVSWSFTPVRVDIEDTGSP